MKKYNGEKYIVSFTTFGKRMALCGKMLFCLTRQTFKDFHIVCTLYKNDFETIPDELQLFIDNDLIEVIEADKDFGPHLKYFYAMKKYYDKPIITVDDDRYYDPRMIQRLVDKFEEIEYKSIVSNCAIKMAKKSNGRLTYYPEWCGRRLEPNERSYIAMAEGFAGILYPPKCFNNLDNEIPEILKCKFDDDLFLKVLHIKNNLPVTQVNFKPKYDETNNVNEMMEYNLHNNQNKGNTNRQNMCKLFEKELLQAFKM